MMGLLNGIEALTCNLETPKGVFDRKHIKSINAMVIQKKVYI